MTDMIPKDNSEYRNALDDPCWDHARALCREQCKLTGTYKYRGKEVGYYCHDRCMAHQKFLTKRYGGPHYTLYIGGWTPEMELESDTMTTFEKPPYSLPHDENEEPTEDRRFDPRAKRYHSAMEIPEIAERNRAHENDHATPAWYYGVPIRPWFEFCL
jgi:hypothetical protein